MTAAVPPRPRRGFSAERARRAIERAVKLGRASGFDVERGEIVAEGPNILVRMAPEPVLARVSHLVDLLRLEGALPWFEREIAVTRYLGDVGFPAPRPLTDPLRDDEGVSISFWEWLEHDPRPQPSEVEVAGSLGDLHRALAEYPGALPDIRDVLAETPVLCARMREEPSLRAVADAFEHKLPLVVERIDALNPERWRPLHGDAHAWNMVATDGGLMWIDFEDACSAPVEYDLACLLAYGLIAGHDEQAVLDAYPGGVDHAALDVMLEARFLQTAVWAALLMTERPSDRLKGRVDWWLERYAE